MNIFISYDSANSNSARALAVQLGILGHNVHFEEKVIGGQVTWDQIFAGIEQCNLFVACITRESFKLNAREVEYDYAWALGKSILCVMLDGVDVDALPAQLVAIPPINYRDRKSALSHLADACKCVSPTKAASDSLSSRPELQPTLDKLRSRAIRAPKSVAAQCRLFYDLKQFLERRETFRDAKDILQQFQSHPRVSQEVAYMIGQTFEEIEQLDINRTTSRWTRQILKVVALIIIVPAFLLAATRALQVIPPMLGINNPATSVSAQSSLSDEGAANLPDEDASESTEIDPTSMPLQTNIEASNIGSLADTASSDFTQVSSDVSDEPAVGNEGS